MKDDKKSTESRVEPEHKGSIWTHPHFLYLLGTLLVFLLLIFLSWLGLKLGLVANRGL